MARRKIQLYRRPAPSTAYNVGTILRPSGAIVGRYQREYQELIEELYHEAFPLLTAEAERLIMVREGPSFALDARNDLPLLPGLGSLIARLRARFTAIAVQVATRLTTQVDVNATANLGKSLAEIGESLEVRFNQPAAVASVIEQRIDDNVRLIRRIPERFLTELSNNVQRAVLRGRGLGEVQELMAERYGTQTSWYRNVAEDQVNKAYMAINSERMKSAGIRQAEWIHRSIARTPRHYHELSVDAGGLNGMIFDLDNPPVIDLRTGERGLPGQLPFCHCIMRPVIQRRSNDA